MADITRVKENIKKRFGGKRLEFKGVLGRADGTVKVRGENVYVTLYNGDVIEVFNERVPRVPFRKVVVGYDDRDPSLLQVLRFDNVYNTRPHPNVPNHRDSHLWFSYDPVDVYTEAIMELLPRAAGGLVVRVYAGRYMCNGSYHIMPTKDIDLTAELVTSGAEWVNVEIDSDGVVTHQHSTTVAARELLLPEDIPTTAASKKLLCSVKMYAGQSRIVQVNGNTDIFDPRLTGQGAGGLASAVAWTDVTGKPTIFPPDTSYTDVLYPRKWLKSSDPDANDDDYSGYAKLDLWLNQASSQVFICVDDATAAAVWLPVGGSAGSLIFNVEGTLAVLDSAAQPILITQNIVISNVYLYCEYAGASGSTIVDIILNDLCPVSIFGGASDAPPELAYNDANGWVSVVPSITDFVEGDILTLDITQIAPGARNAVVILQVAGAGGGGGAFNLTFEDQDAGVSVANTGKVIVPANRLIDNGSGEVELFFIPTIPVVAAVPSGTKTTTSSSYADVDGATFDLTIVKQLAGTDVLIEVHATAFSGATNTSLQLGVAESGTDYDIAFIFINPANSHMGFSGMARIAGLAAGSHTFRLRWKRPAGSGTVTMNTDDRVSISAQEVF